MGRKIRRVPLDFNHPLKKVYGGENPFKLAPCYCTQDGQGLGDEPCTVCKDRYVIVLSASRGQVARVLPGFPAVTRDMVSDQDTLWKAREAWRPKLPTGDGFQLWETTSGDPGAPLTPVFTSLADLADHCHGQPLLPAGGIVDRDAFLAMAEADHFYTDHGNGFISV